MNLNFRFASLCVGLFALIGCSTAKPPEQKPDFARGNHIFNDYCAECHLNPENEAPQLDEADDWDIRTYQWVAVMKDHAKNGFLAMPPKGGHAKLTSLNIDDALYFMEIKIRSLPGT